MLAAGVPLTVVSKRLGHSTITITSDTHSHLPSTASPEAATRSLVWCRVDTPLRNTS